MIVQACPQCLIKGSRYSGMQYPLDWILNMLIQMRYCFLVLLLLLVLPSLDPIWSLCGCGCSESPRNCWSTLWLPFLLEHFKLLALIWGVSIILTSSFLIVVPIFVHYPYCIFHLTSMFDSFPELISMTIITVSSIPSLATIHLLLFTWSGINLLFYAIKYRQITF